MNLKTISLATILAVGICTTAWGQHMMPADYVNPFIGASTNVDAAGAYHGLGKTFPGATTPFGMVQVSPNTITGGDNGSGYSYEHNTIEGFAFTQMSGIGWNGDLGNFLVMPTTGRMYTLAGKENGPIKGWRSRYDKATEKASAGYYTATLTDYGIKTECSATRHCGILRFTFPKSDSSRIQIDMARRVGGTSESQYIKVVNDHTIKGWMRCTPEGGGWGNGEGHASYTVYFYAVLSKPMTDYGYWKADIPDDWTRKQEDVESLKYQQQIAKADIKKGVDEMEGRHIGFFTRFSTAADEQVEMKVGISFVDMDGAENNYNQEIASIGFDKVRQAARSMWNNELNRINVSGGTKEEMNIFYTALYHTMIDPRLYQDVDGRYVGGDFQIHKSEGRSVKHTIFSGWDVFRSQFPLQTIINPKLVGDLLNSLTTMAEQSGRKYYERWELLNSYSGCMLGNPALSVLTDAYIKGIRGYDTEKAFEYAVNSSRKFGNEPLGYTPGNTGISYTLEYAYTDWCLSVLAKAMGKTAEEKEFGAKAQYYKNIFDREKGWFRPRNADGSWIAWPEEGRLKEWYGCMECNPYQQGWFVPHDIKGMVELMGGNKKVTADLNDMFSKTPKDFKWNIYYNHANEPVHFVPFLFNRIGSPWLTQKWTRFICDNAYHNKVEGLVGNEDVGQMSAWYVLAASGLHPCCPGDTRTEITSPVFGKVVFNLTDGKTFTIIANNNDKNNIYIQHARLNGKKYNKCHIDYKDIVAGGTLELFMGSSPNTKFGKQ